MAFTEEIARLSEQVHRRIDLVVGEQATKQALILPFLSALGYDTLDPTEVIPDYVSDIATKEGGPLEAVDYAIAINGTIAMLVEAKPKDQKPTSYGGQLREYFTWVVPAKVGIVTNGVEYRFFTDLRDRNVMDKVPFFSFNVFEYEPKDVENLKLFHKDNFVATKLNRRAEEMVHVENMTNLLGYLLRSPSDKFIRFLINEVGKASPNYAIEGRITDRVIEDFKPVIKKSIQNSLVGLVTRPVDPEVIQLSDPSQPFEAEEIEAEATQMPQDLSVEATDEEIQAFAKVDAIAKTSAHYNLEVKYKDVVSYFDIYIEKPAWWMLRLYLSSKKKSIVTRLPVEQVKTLAPDFEVQELSASLEDATSRITISSISELDRLTPVILKCYEVEASKH